MKRLTLFVVFGGLALAFLWGAAFFLDGNDYAQDAKSWSNSSEKARYFAYGITGIVFLLVPAIVLGGFGATAVSMRKHDMEETYRKLSACVKETRQEFAALLAPEPEKEKEEASDQTV